MHHYGISRLQRALRLFGVKVSFDRCWGVYTKVKVCNPGGINIWAREKSYVHTTAYPDDCALASPTKTKSLLEGL